MNTTLSPDRPVVERNTILNLIVKTSEGKSEYGLFLVLESFDYNDAMAEVRIDGAVKSEDVFSKLTRQLVDRKTIMPVESYTLDLGERGRACGALKDSYHHQLNDWSSMAKVLMTEVERHHFDFMGPEGLLHLLKVNNGPTLGQVFIEIKTGNYEYTTLDIIGPEGADYPEDFKGMIQKEITRFLRDKYSDVPFELMVSIRQSDLSKAIEVLHVVKSSSNHRHFQIGVTKRFRRPDAGVVGNTSVANQSLTG